MKPRWGLEKWKNRFSWSQKEIKYLKKTNKIKSTKEIAKFLGRTEEAIKVKRSLLKLNPLIEYAWTLEKLKIENSNIVSFSNRGKSSSARVLLACPIQSVGCSAKHPRWIQLGGALVSKGRCSSCANFKGGVIVKGGYRKISIRGKTVLEHRYVMEKVLNRKLLSGETVHHGPGGRADNRPENLELRAPGKHKQGWSIKEMKNYLLTIPKSLGGLK